MNRNAKVYKLVGIETAMHLLRPNAAWEITNNKFTRWEDPRPCPTIEEVYETIEKIKSFEDSIPTIYTNEQLEAMGIRDAEISEALSDN